MGSKQTCGGAEERTSGRPSDAGLPARCRRSPTGQDAAVAARFADIHGGPETRTLSSQQVQHAMAVAIWEKDDAQQLFSAIEC